MVNSMTAYASFDTHANFGTVVWEIKSVNHKFCDIHFKFPDEYRDQEFYFREEIKKHIARGRIDCFLNIKYNQEILNKINLNTNLINNYIASAEDVNSKLKNSAPISALALLKMPGVLISEEKDVSSIKEFIRESFVAALKKFKEVRQKEGADLVKVILPKLKKITEAVKTITQSSDEIVNKQKEKIKKKIEDLNISVDSERLEQELVFFANKIDVKEEIDRLNVHIETTKNSLEKGKVIGRKLDFLMQELNREANTLASKAQDSISSSLAIELKVLIEQIREQVQNIE